MNTTKNNSRNKPEMFAPSNNRSFTSASKYASNVPSQSQFFRPSTECEHGEFRKARKINRTGPYSTGFNSSMRVARRTLGDARSKSRLSSPLASTKQNERTYEPSDFQMMKIESSLGQLCKDLDLEDQHLVADRLLIDVSREESIESRVWQFNTQEETKAK